MDFEEGYYVVREDIRSAQSSTDEDFGPEVVDVPEVIDGPYDMEVIAEANSPKDAHGFEYRVERISEEEYPHYEWT